MSKVDIIDNLPYCGECKVLLSDGAENYYLAKDKEGGSHLAFVRRCPKCRKSLTYYTSTDFNRRYLIEEGE